MLRPSDVDVENVPAQRDEPAKQTSSSGPPKSSPSKQFERRLLKFLLRAIGSPDMSIQLWDGQVVSANDDTNTVFVRLQDRATLWKLISWPDYEFGESYISGELTTENDLSEVVSKAFYAWRRRASHPLLQHLISWLSWPNRSLSRARNNVHRHYDLGNDFFQLWLDQQLLYTCAYYTTENQSLEQAQISKMEHVCRKLQLKPGDRVIEAGCGWGALALYMARNYGVHVTACNVSSEQIKYARQQAQREGLHDRINFLEEDWRLIKGECDVFVSIGMLEHVGPEHYAELGQIIDRCLTPQGRGLIHTIGRNQPRALDYWTRSRIFPGAHPPTLSQAMDIFEPFDFAIIDVENLRLHYARTLRHWRERYEDNVDAVQAMFDDEFVRMWRLYLSASISAFETGWLQLFQILFTRATNNNLPLTREHLYSRPHH